MLCNFILVADIFLSAHYKGYSSDVCRSFFIPPPSRSLLSDFWNLMKLSKGSSLVTSNAELHQEKLKVWDIVLEAQTQAAKMFKPNNTAASVDIAARAIIDDAGYKGTFTHRLGHGIGIKGKRIVDHNHLEIPQN